MIVGAKVVFDADETDDLTELTPCPDIFGEYKVATNAEPLNLRQYPTTESEIIIEMPKHSTFTCYGFTDSSRNWYLGEYAYGGKIFAGFASKQYLERRP